MRLIIALRIANASSPFQTAIKFIFDGFQNEEVTFSNTIRSLLVDNILNNLDFENDLKNSILKLSDVFSDGFGGSSGPLWGAFISTGAA